MDGGDDLRGGGKPAKLGLVLGAGAARGWAHIGALRALERMGATPDIIVGCSSGALVGASYANGRLDKLERFARTLTWRGVLGYFDLTWKGGGLIEGRWLVDFFREHVGDVPIESTPMPFAAVATELRSGRETWLTEGSIVDAVRASISLPGLVTPMFLDGRWLVDGALVNPIPVSLCRAMGADVIIAVSMQGDLVTNSRASRAISHKPEAALHAGNAAPAGTQSSWLEWLVNPLSGWGAAASAPEGAESARKAAPGDPAAGGAGAGPSAALSAEALAAAKANARPVPVAHMPGARPGYFDVIGDSFFTVQNFVSRVRLAADPVDLLIAPKLDQLGVMDFHRGEEAIAAGAAAVEAQADGLRALLDAMGRTRPIEKALSSL